MDRVEAIEMLTVLVGEDLRQLADQYGVTVWKNDKKNKGWLGRRWSVTSDYRLTHRDRLILAAGS